MSRLVRVELTTTGSKNVFSINISLPWNASKLIIRELHLTSAQLAGDHTIFATWDFTPDVLFITGWESTNKPVALKNTIIADFPSTFHTTIRLFDSTVAATTPLAFDIQNLNLLMEFHK